MSGFSADWLALREPADHASVNAAVRAELLRHFARAERLRVVDLGCGAGSNVRGLAPALPGAQAWTLVDYDPVLLAVARQRCAGVRALDAMSIADRQADFSAGDFAPLIAGADLVTAAALFDLVSAEVIGRLADAIAAERSAFYTVLSYDGIASFLPEHPANRAMREAFNAHQTGDKGFGPAAGPGATGALAAAFTARGYHVTTGKSPWVLDQRYATLRAELETGWAAAVAETGQVARIDIDSWLAHRRAATDGVTIVGHEDLLALPPAS